MFLTNAIECFLLLASTERRLSSRTLAAYSQALSKLETFALANQATRLVQLSPNLLRGAAASEMSVSPRDNRASNWRGGEVMAATMITATRTMLRRLSEEYPELSLPDLSMVKGPRVPLRIQPRLGDGEYVQLEATLRLRLLRDRVPRFLIARDMAILSLLGNSGLRAEECCRLDVGDVDLVEGAVTVRKGKGSKWRILSIRDPDADARDGGEVVMALGDYLRYRERVFGDGQSESLWLTAKGNRLDPDGLRRMLNVLCEEAGIEGNRPPHAFRRAYFTEQYAAQPTSLPVLIERMGWESEVMVKTYTRGVDIELARRISLPLLSKKWRRSPKVPVSGRRFSAVFNNGVGPPGGRTLNDAAPFAPARRDGNRAASQARRNGPAPLE